jgi:hypothetical protein
LILILLNSNYTLEDRQAKQMMPTKEVIPLQTYDYQLSSCVSSQICSNKERLKIIFIHAEPVCKMEAMKVACIECDAEGFG